MISVMLLPKIDDETSVSPMSMTRPLIVSHSGPIRDRRYWQIVSSHAQFRLFQRLITVLRTTSDTECSPDACGAEDVIRAIPHLMLPIAACQSTALHDFGGPRTRTSHHGASCAQEVAAPSARRTGYLRHQTFSRASYWR